MFKITQGQHKTFRLRIRNKDGSDYNLTSCTVYCTVGTTTKIEKSSGDSAEIEIVNATAGHADLKFVPADTATKDPNVYEFDVWVRDADSKDQPGLKDNIEIEKAVTPVPIP